MGARLQETALPVASHTVRMAYTGHVIRGNSGLGEVLMLDGKINGVKHEAGYEGSVVVTLNNGLT